MKYYFLYILSISLIILLFTSFSYARPFGSMTSSHITNAVKRQIRSAIIPTLKTKKNKIQTLKQIYISKNNRYWVLSMQEAYISIWDTKKGQEIDKIKLNGLVPHSLAIDESNKLFYLLDKKGILYSKALVASGYLKKVAKIQKNYLFKFIAINSKHLILGSNKNKIFIFDKNKINKQIASFQLNTTIVSMDISQNNNKIIVSDNKKILSIYQYSSKTKKLLLLKRWSLSKRVHKIFANKQGNGIALLFDNGQYAYLYKNKNAYGTLHYSKKKVQAIELVDNTLNIFTQDKQFFKQNIKTGKTINFRTSKKIKAQQIQLYNNGQFALISKKNQGLFLIQIKNNETIAQLILTKSAWAILDKQGRYDGNDDAFHDVSWDAEGQMLELAQFSKKYFEPGLLKKLLNNDQKMITAPNAPIQKGIHLPPTVNISIASNKSVYATEQTITLTIQAKSEDTNSDLHDLKVYHNGKRIPSTAIKLHKNHKKSKEWRLGIYPTKDNNKFFATVNGWEDVLGQSQTLQIKAKQTNVSTSTLPPQFFLKSIGINQYASDDLKLNFAVSDAQTIFKSFSKSPLSKQSDTKNHIRTLILDKQASKQKILNLLEKTRLQSKKNDLLVVFMAGHGVVVDHQWYFLPQEARSDQDMSKIKSTWLSSKELMEKFVAIPSQNILLIIDACQSGGAILDFNNFHQRRTLRGLSKETGIHIITATRADQDAPEFSELGHGLFTYVVLKGIKKSRYGYFNADTSPRNGQLTVSELQEYVVKNVPILAHKMAPKYFRTSRGEDSFDERIIVTPTVSTQGNNFVIYQ